MSRVKRLLFKLPGNVKDWLGWEENYSRGDQWSSTWERTWERTWGFGNVIEVVFAVGSNYDTILEDLIVENTRLEDEIRVSRKTRAMIKKVRRSFEHFMSRRDRRTEGRVLVLKFAKDNRS
jgi:hypothetical protein